MTSCWHFLAYSSVLLFWFWSVLFYFIFIFLKKQFSVTQQRRKKREIKNNLIKSWKYLIDNKIVQNGPRDYDQTFLKNIIYPKIISCSLIHTSFYRYRGEYTKSFPIPYCKNYYHVGGYVHHDDSVSTEHTNILKNACVPGGGTNSL